MKRLGKGTRWLIALTVLGLLFLCLLLSLHWFFPNDRVKEILADQVYQATGRVVEIETLNVRLFGGVAVKGLRIGFTPEEHQESGYFLTAEKGYFYYSLLPLLRRRIVIKGIEVENPQCHLILPAPGEADSTKTQTAVPLALPIHIQLDLLKIKNASVRVDLPDPNKKQRINISGFSAELKDVFVPRQFWDERHRIQFQGRFHTHRSRLSLFLPGQNVTLLPDFQVNVQCQSDLIVTLQGRGEIRSPRTAQMLGALDLKVQSEGLGDRVQIGQCAVQMLDTDWFHCQGEVRDVLSDLWVDFSYQGREILLEEIKPRIQKILAEMGLAHPLLASTEIEGAFNLEKGRIHGKLDSLSLNIRPAFSKLTLHQDSLGIHAENGRGQLRVSGLWTAGGLARGEVMSRFNLHQLQLSPQNDTLFVMDKINLRLNTRLDSAFFPETGSVSLRIHQLAGSPVKCQVNWQGSSLKEGSLYGRFDGLFQAGEIDLQTLPSRPPGLSGIVSIDAVLTGQRSDSIGIDLKIETSPVQYQLGEYHESLPPIQSSTSLVLGYLPGQQQVFVEKGRFQFDSLCTARFSGCLMLDSLDADFQLTQCRVSNAPVQDYLPLQIKDQIGPFDVGGQEIIQASAVLNLQNPESLRLRGACEFVDAACALHVLDLSLSGGQGKISLSGPVHNLAFDGSLFLKQAGLTALRSKPIRNSRVEFQGRFIEQKQILLKTSHVEVPDFKMQASMKGRVELSEALPDIDFSGNGQIQAADTIQVVDDLWVQGNALIDFKGHINADSLFCAEGRVKGRRLGLQTSQGLKIQDIEVNLPFMVQIDPLKGRLVSREILPIAGSTMEMEPRLYRTLYADMGHIHISEVRFAPFYASDLQVDLRMADGWLDIPRFQMSLLDGNLGGKGYLNLADGNVANMRFGLEGQGARINSAALQTTRSENQGDTEVNAAFAFTGYGLDIQKSIDVDGYFHITKIGSDFAGTLLKQLDPKGVDRNIRMTGSLLSMGYQPRLFSFEMRHGYVYPTLHLNQPWFSPLRIPEEFSYPRLPLAFFLDFSIVQN